MPAPQTSRQGRSPEHGAAIMVQQVPEQRPDQWSGPEQWPEKTPVHVASLQVAPVQVQQASYPLRSAQPSTPAHLFHRRWAQVAELHRHMRQLVASGRAARHPSSPGLHDEFDRAFPSPARLMAFWHESATQDQRTWDLGVTMAFGLWSTGRIDGAVDYAGPDTAAARGLIEALARHVSEQARWTQAVGIEYVLQQQTPDGLWSSIPHWNQDVTQVHRSVQAGYLHGQARWAVAVGDGMEPSFLCGIDAQGRPLSASAVADQVKFVQGYELTGRQPLIQRFRA